MTGLNTYSGTSSWASYNATTGYVTFTTTTSPDFVPGSEFTVSGMSPSGFNQTYVAVAGTSGTTIVGNPLSGPAGTLQANNPGASIGSGGSLVSVILPGMKVLGTTGSVVIGPYQQNSSTGTGGAGTYSLTATQASFTFTGSISGTTLTLGSTPLPLLVPGEALTSSTGSGFSATKIVALLTGNGSSGSTYQVDVSQTAASGTITAAGTIGSSGAPANIFAYAGFYYSAAPSSNPSGGAITASSRAALGDFITAWGEAAGTSIPPLLPAKSGWGGTIGNIAMLYGALPQTTGGVPSTTALASLCKKTTDIQSFAVANSLTVNSLYRLNDIGVFGDSSVADFTGSISGTSLTVISTQFGSLPTVAAGSPTVVISGPGITGCPSSCPKIQSGPISGVYTLNASGGTVTAEPMKAGAFAPMTPAQSNTLGGYIDAAGSVPTLHVLSLPTTPANAAANFTGSLGTQFTASIASGTNQLVVTAPTSGGVALGQGMTVNIPGGTPSMATITGIGTALGYNGTYTLSATVTGAATSETMFGTGTIPGPPTALFNVGSITGTIRQGMYVTDGGASLTGSPLLITGGSGSTWTVAGNYYGSIINDTTMVGSQSAVVPGEYILNSAISNPVKVLSYQGACTITGAINGGLGCYTLSASPNASGLVGSSGSSATLIGTTISDGGAIAPGPALTIKNQGPGVTFPVDPTTISCSAFGSCTGSGKLWLSGAYDAPTLGGTPSEIQVLVSNSANGTPLAGCTPCNWGALTGTISGGIWSGTISGIPAGGPYSVSVRSSNGTAYATLPDPVRVGIPVDFYGQGQVGNWSGLLGGTNVSFYQGLWGLISQHSLFSGPEPYTNGPAITGSFTPAAATSVAGDRFGINGAGSPIAEGPATLEQTLTNAFGWPSSVTLMARDGVGNLVMTMGGVAQTQSIGLGDGSSTTWCSAAKFCSSVTSSGPLWFNAASLTGATLNGATISQVGSLWEVTFPATTGLLRGALAPNLVLTGAGINAGTTLSYCVTNCTIAAQPTSGSRLSQTWALSGYTGSAISTGETMHADPVGGSVWSAANPQVQGVPFGLAGDGDEIVKAGTFKLSINGTVVCQDTATFAYNNMGGNCVDTGGGVVSSGWINYVTGDYELTFNTAPTTSQIITASWTNIISPDASASQYSRVQNLDYWGDGTEQGGTLSALAYKSPGGVAGHINSGCSTDEGYILQNAAQTNNGYQWGAPGYAQETYWLYAIKFPGTFPGFSASTPQITAGQYRGEGAQFFNSANNSGKLNICDQFFQDFVTASTWTGHISGTTLTLDSNAVGSIGMWEGEVVGVNGVASPTGIQIENLCTVATCGAASPAGWGQINSTYFISNPGGVSTSTGAAMLNDVYYKGSGPTIYGGSAYDINVQSGGLAQTTGYQPHMWTGFTGASRVSRRMAADIWGGLTSPANASPPSLSRANNSAAGTPSPAFDYTNTYAATATGTVATVGGVSVVTFSSGLSAHARPFVDGQWVTCVSCTPQVITSVSVPPTQSIASGAGEVGQSFTITLGGLLGVTGSKAITAGCTGSGGSNCINFDFSINTTNGTFGTAAALATCGANNLNGNAPNYATGAGVCQDSGIGSLTRGFRIGTTQNMYTAVSGSFQTGSVFDDGADFVGGAFNRSGTFTCNIVATKIVQCVHGPTYASGVATGVGKWTSGSTFANYGDMSLVTGRAASVLGYVGGQSFPISNAGSGYLDGFYTGVIASCATTATGFTLPRFDLKVLGGVIVDVYPSATSASLATQAPGLGIGSACTLTDANFSTTMKNSGAGSGGSINIQLAPTEGVGGVATYNTDTNEMGTFLYDNTGEVGNPLNPFFTNGTGGYFEPGLPVRAFGESQGAAVSG